MTAQELKDDFSRSSLQEGSQMVADRIEQRGHSCARCGRYESPSKLVLAPTGKRFCEDTKACLRRAVRRLRLASGVAA